MFVNKVRNNIIRYCTLNIVGQIPKKNMYIRFTDQIVAYSNDCIM